VEHLPRIGDMAGPLGTSGDAMVGQASVACGLLAPLPRSLAPFVHFCHHFCTVFAIISYIQIILQVQVELGEL
jgi:hypothetical protein